MLKALHPVLSVPDIAAAIGFYKQLGFALIFQDDPDSPRYAAVKREGIELHLQWADPSQLGHPGDRPAYRFLVDDVVALYAEFKAGGAVNRASGDINPWHAPADTTWGTKEFHLRDPGRNSLQFYQPA